MQVLPLADYYQVAWLKTRCTNHLMGRPVDVPLVLLAKSLVEGHQQTGALSRASAADELLYKRCIYEYASKHVYDEEKGAVDVIALQNLSQTEVIVDILTSFRFFFVLGGEAKDHP